MHLISCNLAIFNLRIFVQLETLIEYVSIWLVKLINMRIIYHMHALAAWEIFKAQNF